VKALIRSAEESLGRFPGLVVHLKSTLPETTLFDRPVIFGGYGNRLNILSRGMEREQAVREILRELVRMDGSRPVMIGHRLSAAELKAVDTRVEEILPAALRAIEPGSPR
jgi:hypothetical protein